MKHWRIKGEAAMNKTLRIGSLAAVLGLGLVVVALILSGLSTASASGNIDMTVELKAPSHVRDGSTYEVRIIYYNFGTSLPPDAQVTATLPAETQFIASAGRSGTPLPPDVTDGQVLSWYFENPNCNWPLNACCGHIVLTLQADEGLPEGTELTTHAAVATTAVDSDMTNNESSVVSVVGAMAGSTKQVHARSAKPGDVLTYTITLSMDGGTGKSKGQWVTLTDTLPFSHQVRFLGWRGTVTGTMHGGHTLRWQGQVQAGKPLQLQYRLGVEDVVTPGTVLSGSAMLRWGEQLMQLGPVTTVVTLPHGALALGPNGEGQVRHRHGVTLTVPPGAVTDTTNFEIRPLFTDSLPSDPPGRLLFANRAFEMVAHRFGHQVGQFNAPLTITLNYSDTDVVGLKRETLRLWTRSGPEGPWAKLGEPARVMSGSLSFTTTHFSQFALFGEGQFSAFLPVVIRTH
jgi:uncharacterized repeat protein (TIGR01451 family)